MKIKSIKIQGFRGFNEERSINFHERLTLIYAPNSYGKTSISEALEWLLYGVTSKVEYADSKEEYKGSYRNRHLSDSQIPFVKALFRYESSEIELRGELLGKDSIKKIFKDNEVEEWFFANVLSETQKPFILQHALKNLLLATPDNRFQGFARLLGLGDLDKIHKNIIALCTKPEAKIPNDVSKIQIDINNLKNRLTKQSSLVSILKAFNKGTLGLTEMYSAIKEECKRHIPPQTKEESIIPQLLRIREEAVGKIFKGRIALNGYSAIDKQKNSDDENYLLNFVTADFIVGYTSLAALATIQHIINRAQFFDLGVDFLNKAPGKCPFCDQPINETISQHITDEHLNLSKEKELNTELQKQRDNILKSLKDFRDKLRDYQSRNSEKALSFLEMESSLNRLEAILIPKYQTHYNSVKSAIILLSPIMQNLKKSYIEIDEILDRIEISIAESKEDATLMKCLGEKITKYISDTHSYSQVILDNTSKISEADQILKHELDELSGTGDVSILIDLLEFQDKIKKQFEVDDILNNIKDMKSIVDNFVANKMLDAITGELTSEVMEWYGQIKTSGDPDVHFGGFEIERKKSGELKARRVQIKAISYGKDLISAVSSLSESKLNSLGLCVSIATNLKGNSPFKFLIIDDPIQSWDAEHEIQFIQVIRKLVERGKQVILLSHNKQWIELVRKGCRTLNGRFYEITGYTKQGPHISELPWENWMERLKEVDAIAKDPSIGSVRLQQAEEEIRIVIAQITSELYQKRKGSYKSPHDLNSEKVRKMLIECGIEQDLVDRLIQTFETTDDAHHAPKDYAVNRQRIKTYHSWAHELGKFLN